MFSRAAPRLTSVLRTSTLRSATRSLSGAAASSSRAGLGLAPLALMVGAGFVVLNNNNNSQLNNASVAACDAAALPVWGKAGTNQERTFLAVKPDGVQRGLIGDIISRFEKRGYKLVGLKMVWPTPDMAEAHYADLSTKPFFKGLTKFFSSGPVVCMCWEGKDIIKQGRTMLGETQPLASAPGSIRGDYSIDLGRNICHGSDSPESAQHELKMWFPEGVNDWTKSVDTSVYEKQ
eukprot:CAMPEP_0198152866 /NCGR_PEP_ID=MMETSP1443-20131203/61525_1 /TAXON_ID=186043 /ORGANISM="Entomoneis sp., Strain CCMP2396" /LENGTH=233 /DNA_ID=CAMNT_0043818999 /DNA_START=174 /DNA_END=875 /DNA_ORIENTATION=-